MSQENVEVARRAFDNFNRRELATAVEAFDPDAEWIPYLAALEEHTYRGRERIEAMWREVLRDFPDFRIELMEVVTDRGDTIVVKVEFQGMGRASGADTRTAVFQVASFRDGKWHESRGSEIEQRPSKRWGCASSAVKSPIPGGFGAGFGIGDLPRTFTGRLPVRR